MKKLLHLLSKKLEESLLNRFYWIDIKEMPMYNWMRLCDENDMRWINRNGKEGKLSNKALDIIQAQIIDNFGISQEYKTALSIELKIEQLYNEMILKGKKTNQAFIEVEQIKLDELRKTQNNRDTTFTELCQVIEKRQGYRINPKDITVYEFYSYVQSLAKQN